MLFGRDDLSWYNRKIKMKSRSLKEEITERKGREKNSN